MTMGVYDYYRGDIMQLTYYNNKSDKRYVNKNIEAISLQDHDNPVTVALIDDCDIINPTFKVRDTDIYMTANYCYCDELRRYYFIDNITLSQGFAFLHCTVDVLMTYKEPLKASPCIVSRQEHKPNYDMYQNDGNLPIKQYPAKRCIGKFSTPFSMKTNQYVLGVVGSTSGGDNT